MKALLTFAFVSALAAFLFSPVRLEVGVSLLFTAGFAAIVLSDYTRRVRPLRIVTPITATPARRERFGLAA